MAGAAFYVTTVLRAVPVDGKTVRTMFGVGHSIFLTQQAIRVTGDPRIGAMFVPEAH